MTGVANLLLRGGRLHGRGPVDITISGGIVTRVEESGALTGEQEKVIDLDGRLVLPAFGEPHAHLDKAYTADLFPNPAGDLIGAVEVVRAGWEKMPIDDIVGRALSAARRLVASGTTAIRTHADVTPEGGTKSVEALAEVRRRLDGVCVIEVVAMAFPFTGPEGAIARHLLDAALDEGADVVGGVPHLEDDPAAAIAFALETAVARSLSVDLHMDEELDESIQNLPELARRTEQAGLSGRVTASHCVSHGLLPADGQRATGRMLADAGVSVVTLPRTNLFLQARGRMQAPPRGLAGVRALIEERVTVAAGGDNVQDPFYVIGRSDPLETASYLVAAAHLDVEEAGNLIGAGVRQVLGLAPLAIEPGAPADLVAIRAGSLREAIADQPADRIVLHGGRVVAQTSVEGWVAGG